MEKINFVIKIFSQIFQSYIRNPILFDFRCRDLSFWSNQIFLSIISSYRQRGQWLTFYGEKFIDQL